ncbi:hypothetical protein [Rhodococcoides fascians]|uniref:hypothetical protein n=1 Tax=Rhodococcoides fascians TaxID=1828 RepID=UPI00055D1D58|nr:hypothetical protein [Rhodococcus fascians]
MNAHHAANDATAARLAAYTENARECADHAEEHLRADELSAIPSIVNVNAARQAATLAEYFATLAGSDRADEHAARAREAAQSIAARL